MLLRLPTRAVSQWIPSGKRILRRASGLLQQLHWTAISPLLAGFVVVRQSRNESVT